MTHKTDVIYLYLSKMEFKENINFRDKIFELLKKYHVSQKQLCKAIGMRESSLSRYLNNKQEIQSISLQDILNYFLKLETIKES